jgi:4-diphosphocytidyl-2-C-methyl-D-erythritol kinase
VLVNPGVEVPTREVFSRLHRRENPPLPPLPEGLDTAGFIDWLGETRNDLQAPAEAMAPGVTAVLEKLRRAPGVLMALMSGSGATCVGVTRDLGTARDAARMIQIAASGWWVAPAPLLGGPVAAVAAGVPVGPQVARVTT